MLYPHEEEKLYHTVILAFVFSNIICYPLKENRKKMKKYRCVLFILLTIYFFGFNEFIGIGQDVSINRNDLPKIIKKTEYKVLIVDCRSTLYSELCNLTADYLTQEKISYIIYKKNYSDIQDIVSSKLKGFDLLIISGSSNFFPDSPEVKDVATLLKIAIKQNKNAFGVCFGLQLLAYLLDSEEGELVKKGAWDKNVELDILKDDLIFKNIGIKGDSFLTRQYHKYSVPFHNKKTLGHGTILAKSKDGIEIIRVGFVVATQFHPESRYASKEARKIFENYLKEFVSLKRLR